MNKALQNFKIQQFHGKDVWIHGNHTQLLKELTSRLGSMGAQVLITSHSQDSLDQVTNYVKYPVTTRRLDFSWAQHLPTLLPSFLGSRKISYFFDLDSGSHLDSDQPTSRIFDYLITKRVAVVNWLYHQQPQHVHVTCLVSPENHPLRTKLMMLRKNLFRGLFGHDIMFFQTKKPLLATRRNHSVNAIACHIIDGVSGNQKDVLEPTYYLGYGHNNVHNIDAISTANVLPIKQKASNLKIVQPIIIQSDREIVLVQSPFYPKTYWNHIKLELEKRDYTVHTIDFPSEPTVSKPLMASLVFDLQLVLKQALQSRFPIHIVAHGWACPLVSHLTSEYPEGVKSISLLAPLGLHPQLTDWEKKISSGLWGPLSLKFLMDKIWAEEFQDLKDFGITKYSKNIITNILQSSSILSKEAKASLYENLFSTDIPVIVFLGLKSLRYRSPIHPVFKYWRPHIPMVPISEGEHHISYQDSAKIIDSLTQFFELIEESAATE